MQVINIILIATISAMPYGEPIWSNSNDLSRTNFNRFNSPAPSNGNGVQFFKENSDQVQDAPWNFSEFSEPNSNNLESEPKIEPTIAIDPMPLSNWEDGSESSFNDSEFPSDESSDFAPFISESSDTFDNDDLSTLYSESQGNDEWSRNTGIAIFPNGGSNEKQESPFNSWNFSSEDTQQFGNDGEFKQTQQPKINKQFQAEQGQGQLGFHDIRL